VAQETRPILTPEQKQRLKAFACEARRKTANIRDEIRLAREELRNVYQDYVLDERKAKAAMNRIGDLQLRLLEQHLDNQIALRRILDESQFSRLREHIERRRSPGEGVRYEGVGEGFVPLAAMRSAGLTPAQRKRIESMQGSRSEWRDAIERIRQNSRRMFELYNDYNLDEAAARRLIADIHRNQVDLLACGHKMQKAIRSVLSAEQFQRLREEIDKRPRFKDRGRRFLRD